MPITATTTEHHLTTADKRAAKKISQHYDEWEGKGLELCREVAEACDARWGYKEQFLAEALPKVESASSRNKILYAGLEANRRRRQIDGLKYGPTVLAEIYSLPESAKDWAYEEKRSREEIRDKKKQLKGTNDPVTPKETEVFNDMTDVVEELLKENAELRQQLHDHNLSPQPLPQHDPLSRTTFDPSEHEPSVQVGSKAHDDLKRVHELLSEINEIEGRYYCKGIWGPAEWGSLFGAHTIASASSSAQRNYKPRSQQDPEGQVWDIDYRDAS